ncbi:MAG TPA: hypothetical protein VFI18_03365 [Gaiellales bacterium]|nr:hypothetical protein [Gaiellales bacterium]
MLGFHRIASVVGLALVTVALLAPVAQARPATAGGVAAPVTNQTTPAGAAQASRDNGGTDWNAVFAGAAGGALIIAMGAGGVGLLRRRTLAT